MSRHRLAARPETGATHAIIGWDRPLATYFVQVLGNVDDEEQIILWQGTDYGEIPTPAAAIALLAPYCTIPDGLAAQLEIDRMATLASNDGPSQHAARILLRRISASDRND